MRVPSRVVEHPIEAVIASLLLLGLLFGSTDFTASRTSPAASGAATAQKL